MGDQLKIYLILVPGAVTVGMASLLGSVPPSSGVSQIVLLLFFSIINLAIALALSQVVLWVAGKRITLGEIQENIYFLMLLLAISLCFGLIFAIGYENAWLNRGARSIVGANSGLLTKENNTSLLHDLLLNSFGSNVSLPDSRDPDLFIPEKHITFLVYVSIKGSDDDIVGYRSHWDGAQNVSSIYLTPACIVRSGKTVPISGAGVYVPIINVEYLKFIDEVSSDAKCPFEMRGGN